MAFLDKKERILDLVLTNKGRELLSKNLLDFTYYAFSDEGVDYSGSLALSGNIDDHIHQTLTFEADPRKNGLAQTANTSLQTFLYTIPSRRRTLPEFKSSHEDGAVVNLERQFYIDTLTIRLGMTNRIRRPIATVARMTARKSDLFARNKKYSLEQQVNSTKIANEQGKNVVGMPVSRNYIATSPGQAINIRTGLAQSMNGAQMRQELKDKFSQEIISIEKEIEVVAGIDRANFFFRLKSEEGQVPSVNGFLVEMYVSGSDGTLTKIADKTITNPIVDDVIQDGFDTYLDLFTGGKK